MLRHRVFLPSACLLLIATAARPALAQVAPAPSAGPSPYQLNLLYTGELWNNAEGGVRQGTTYMENLDAQLRIDTDRAFGWTGGRFWLEGFYESKNSLGNQYVGAVDQQSPIDSAGFEMFRLYQAYYDQQLGQTDVRFGIYDLESEFSVTKPMSLFLSKDLTWNTAFDQSGTMPQNGTVGPGNYPYTPLALRVREQFSHDWSIQSVLADGVADNPKNQTANAVDFADKYGLLSLTEVDFTPTSTTKVMTGFWALTSELPENDAFTRSGANRQVWGEEGGYIGGATRLYTQQGRRGLDGFLTLGISSPTSTNTEESLNGGLVYTGLLDSRPHDKFGFAFNENVAPQSFRDQQIAEGNGFQNYETSFELTYRAPITSWLTAQPDVQYIIHPGYDPMLRNDLVIGLHFEIGHLFDL
jgi:porin